MNPIITQSRYGDKRTIECVDPEKGIFKIYGKTYFCRQGEGMFDFEGGPMLEVGEQFYGFGTIAGLDATKREEDHGIQDTDACVYVSVDMNKKTILAFRKGEDVKPSKEKNTKSYMDSLCDLYNPKEPNDER
jgi:hypothetical protein